MSGFDMVDFNQKEFDLEKSLKNFFKETKDFIRAWCIAFASVWVLLLVPILTATGKVLLFIANAGERYLDSRVIR